MVGGWAVALRGIRYRPGRSLMVLLLATIAIATAVLAPAYSRAAQQSVLTDRLAQAPADASGLQLRSDPVGGAPAPWDSTADAELMARQLLSHRPTLASRLDRPVAGSDVDSVLTPGADQVLARLTYRDSVCAHLTFTAGRCATESGSVMLSARSAAEYHLGVGQAIYPRGRTATTASTHPLTIAGLYQPRDAADPYWGRGGYFAAGPPSGDASLPRMDAVFAADEEDLRLPSTVPSVYLDYRLQTSAVRLDDVEHLQNDLQALTTDVHAGQLDIATSLRSVLDDIGGEASSLGRTVPVVAVPLVLVCWFVLFLLVAALTDERAPEVALAKLRGYSLRRAGRFGRAEALWLVGLAVPLGLVLGLSIVEVAARTMLGPGVHVELRWPVLVAAAIGVIAAYLAVRLGSGRTLARPALALLRRVPERGGWRAGITEGVVVAVAAASLAAAASNRSAPLALLAPALIALVAGVVTARLLSAWSRTRVRGNARRGRVSGLLAHAQLARRPLGHRIMLVVTVAVALLSFAATAWDVAAQARGDVAADTVGADRVVRVTAADPAALVAAVTAADGDGSAMPVVRASEQYGDHDVELVGVASDRLAGVAVWRGHSHQQLAQLADLLRPPAASPLPVSGYIEADVTTMAEAGHPRLAALIASSDSPTRTVGLGALDEGRHTYRADLTDCAGGCRLIALAVVREVPGTTPIEARIAVAGLSTASGPLDAGFANAGRWRFQAKRAPQAQVNVQAGSALSIDAHSTDASDTVIEYMDIPDSLPVAVAGGTPADDTSAKSFTFPALGESTQDFTVVDQERSLPRVGDRALLFDLDYAVRAAQRGAGLSDNSRLRYEVWANANAPRDLSTRLAASGLQILDEESIATVQDDLGRGAPALGLRLYLIAGAAAVLLAVGAVLLTAYIGSSTRRYELAALRMTGVRARTLRTALVREYLMLIGAPLVVGVVAGVAGAALMLPGIPLVSVGVAAGPVRYSPAMGLLPFAVGVTLIGLVVALMAVLRLVRSATPDRLREGVEA